MGAVTETLPALRPLSFHLKTDPQGPLQYGLIAEEVARVYPELVIRDASGRIDGVRYDELAPLLLTELQKQGQVIGGRSGQIAMQSEEIASLKAHAADVVELKKQIAELKQMNITMQAALLKLQDSGNRVAMR